MFALVPSLVASPNNTLVSQERVDTSLPAQFVEETLRVAVYAESNLTLPAYATGGVYTDNYQNVIDLLESAGYAVTALTTQDILDRKLNVVDYDAFVLADQLPKDEIINHVNDYWLGGGGILSFDSAVAYLFYTGMIHPTYDGEFMLYPTDPDGRWAYLIYDGITTNSRHPVTKSLEETTVYPFTEEAVYTGGFELVPLLGDQYVELGIVESTPSWSSMFALDRESAGGKIVQLPGNCSQFEGWMEPVIVDAIDWLAPKPKARVAFDFTHTPYYGVDSWDTNVSHVPRFNIWRDFLVNHSFTVDKLYPTGVDLTYADIAQFDVLIVALPYLNYTISEISLIRTWVGEGNGLFYLGDWNGINDNGQTKFNELMEPWGLAIDLDGTNSGTYTTTDFTAHPTLEQVTSVQISGGDFLTVSGNAYPIVNQSTDVMVAASEPGLGRVVACGDVNIFDYTHIQLEHNIQFSINLLNWLSAGTAKVLVYADTPADPDSPNFVPLNSPVAQALNDLGIKFYMTSQAHYFNMSLFRDDYDMVVFDNNNYGTTAYQPHLIDFVEGGGKLVLSTWTLHVATGAYFGVEVSDWIFDPPVVHLWEPDHPIFNLPAPYGASTIETTLDLGFGTDALNFTVFANATPLAGYTAAPTDAAIVLGAGGNVIVNGPLLVSYADDYDDSTYPDNLEIWENEIAFLYFDRPTIDHPADVTYMETETGNEIAWTPTADAGPWEYVFSVNGTPTEGGRWAGGTLTFNIDGVNVSITDYEITVFDRLGYSVSDQVTLNVTEYIAPGPGPGDFDPMLLLIIGAVVGGLLIVLVVLWKLKAKK